MGWVEVISVLDQTHLFRFFQNFSGYYFAKQTRVGRQVLYRKCYLCQFCRKWQAKIFFRLLF